MGTGGKSFAFSVLSPGLSTDNETTGGVSAFAAVHGEADASESPSHSSIESTEAPPCYNENSFLALSDHSGTLPVGPRSVVKLGIDSVTVRLGKGEVSSFSTGGVHSAYVFRMSSWLAFTPCG